MTKDVNLYLKI